ncbi:MAG: GGDEF domain-containing protein, partial [Kosmotogaceae bacterium]|nr:GGDEF domain-containing protein [Kosmotogaceae bacterium]
KLEEINKLLEKQAETDPLTGLLNHRKMKSVLDSEISRAERYETPLTMIMLDLDNFKSINDSYGHLKGDELLAAIGKLIRSSIRKNDFAFRYGGEEFLILLPSADMQRTTEVYSRLKQSLREHLEIAVSFSAGARQWKGESSDEFISIVDKLLYEAKAKGKDRLEISEAAI